MFDLPENLVLEDERVLLRKLRPTDLENLLPFAIFEPEIWQFSLLSAAGEDGMRQYLEEAEQTYRSGSAFPFIVFDKKAKQFAGSTRYYDIQPLQQSLQLGYTWYGKNFRGTGLNLHCKYLLLSYAFEKLFCERVEFRADAKNSRSVAAMKKIGCIEEGILRNHLNKAGGGRRDSIILSILKEEWISGVKEKLERDQGRGQG